MSAAESVARALGSAVDRVGELDPRFLAAALALQLLILVCRALAWRNVLAAAYPGRRLPTFALGCSYAAGVALNAFTPARGGEAAKVALARTQIPGSTVPTIAGSLSVVLALDAALGFLLVTVLWLVGAVPSLPLPSPGWDSGRFVLAGVVVLAGGLAIGLRLRPAPLVRVLRRAAQGAAVLRSPGRYLITVVPFQLVAWACRIGVVLLVLAAFRIEAGLETAALLVVLNGVSTVVPVPGGAGTQQALATFALQGIVSAAGAISFSLGMQVGVTVVNTTVGLVATMLLFRTIRPLSALRATRRAAGSSEAT